MRYLKYEFATKAEFDALKEAHLMTDDHLIKGVDVVELGDIVTTPAVMDEEGNITTPAITTGRHAVDILWKIEPIAELEASLIYPKPCGVHTFAGLTHLYEKEYYEKYPELKPVTDEEDI